MEINLRINLLYNCLFKELNENKIYFVFNVKNKFGNFLEKEGVLSKDVE